MDEAPFERPGPSDRQCLLAHLEEGLQAALPGLVLVVQDSLHSLAHSVLVEQLFVHQELNQALLVCMHGSWCGSEEWKAGSESEPSA